MTETTWTSTTIALSKLKPWERNPKRISKAHAARLLDLWERLGQFQTIAIGPGGEVYDGHQRLSVLKAKHGGGYVVQVLQASRPLTEAEREELTIAAHSGTTGSWDWDALAGWDVDNLTAWGLDEELLSDWNAGATALREMLAAEAAPTGEDPGPQVDRAEELREKWKVEPGQLWQLGEHRLICGDCTDAAVVARVLQGEKPALMVTDPPYGVNYDPNWRNEAAEAGFLSFAERRTGIVTNDDRIDWSDAYALFPGDVAYTWSPGGDHVILTGVALQKAGFQIRNQIIWVKPHFPISRGHYTYQHEPCWYGVRKGRQAHWIGDKNASTTWKIALDKNVDGGHSTQKPLACMATPIANHEGDVYDPFLGSGTTLIACERLGRRARCIEIEPSYIAVCLERWATMTGQTPALLDGAP